MNSRHLVPGVLLLLGSCIAAAALAQSPPADGARFHELDVSAGRWVYHGHFLGGPGAHPSPWTWHEDCHWSDNQVFMLCSFSNTWAGRHVDSVVIDTYDPKRNTFWHYEVYNTGGSAGKPFASRMQIDGTRRTETWTETRKGRTVHQRIVYRFTSTDAVTVQFQQSKDGTHWMTTASGAGEKTGASTAVPFPPK
ncbi:MAG: DUF1579 family protein [Steroidobacteraceae bacterium]